jgi:hypothetical protein
MDGIKNQKDHSRKFKKDATHMFLQGPNFNSNAKKPKQAKLAEKLRLNQSSVQRKMTSTLDLESVGAPVKRHKRNDCIQVASPHVVQTVIKHWVIQNFCYKLSNLDVSPPPRTRVLFAPQFFFQCAYVVESPTMKDVQTKHSREPNTHKRLQVNGKIKIVCIDDDKCQVNNMRFRIISCNFFHQLCQFAPHGCHTEAPTSLPTAYRQTYVPFVP